MSRWLIASLRHPDYNPRTITEKKREALAGTIADFGFLQPLVVNVHEGRVGIVIGGNQRLDLFVEQGLVEVPDLPNGSPGVVEVDVWPLEREKELCFKLNGATGQWDYDKLAKEYKAEDLQSWGFESWELEPPKADRKELVIQPPEKSGYVEQYGVIVICATEADQEALYNRLHAEGLNCKVVVT